ncbi:HAD hydrolase-like protein [Sphingoaurantiacus capsulatus]|uniref:HAD hydrolase-like protein n=1 Tax=Sphingoaurantiacus capsulatus TaxID=1771310 RepID=A0ABV7X9W4_9SPHN
MDTILVDLDGTLTDPAAGIIAAVRHALTTLGQVPPAPEELRWVIGPPLRHSFPRLLGDGCDVEAAVAAYREHYGAGGLFDAAVYDGIFDALAVLRARPARLLVCTAKPQHFATRVLDHFDLSARFDGIYGPDLEGRLDDKGDLIAHMIDVEGFDPAHAVMIGDRGSDVTAARRHGIPTVGVLWGYGSREELQEAGAAVLCASPAELPEIVGSLQ